MSRIKTVLRTGFMLSVLAILSCPVWAADPGTQFPPETEASNQKQGSVLIYPLYASSSTTPAQENTRLDITNTSVNTPAFVHLFFVSGNGSVSDSYVCLTPVQTASFLASDVDPNVRGFIVAVAVSNTGAPINFNFLVGQAQVKLAPNYVANVNAVAVAAINLPMFSGASATLNFDGNAYNRLPRALAADQLASPLDNNTTLLVVNRIGGSYVMPISPLALGAFSGNLYNDQGNAFPFTDTGTGPQFLAQLSNSFPSTSPVFSQVIPAGHTGWLSLATNADAALVGVLLNFNANAATQANAFTSGRLLRALTLTSAASLTIPIVPPTC